MLIAVAANGTEANAVVPEVYEDSAALWIVETDEDKVVALYEKQDDDCVCFSNSTVQHDCEAIVCGRMQKRGFDIVAYNNVTRYYGAGLPPFEAAHAAVDNYLPLITDYEGGPGCGSRDHSLDRCAEHSAEMEEE